MVQTKKNIKQAGYEQSFSFDKKINNFEKLTEAAKHWFNKIALKSVVTLKFSLNDQRKDIRTKVTGQVIYKDQTKFTVKKENGLKETFAFRDLLDGTVLIQSVDRVEKVSEWFGLGQIN